MTGQLQPSEWTPVMIKINASEAMVVLCVAMLALALGCLVASKLRTGRSKGYAKVVAVVDREAADFTDNEAKPMNADVGV